MPVCHHHLRTWSAELPELICAKEDYDPRSHIAANIRAEVGHAGTAEIANFVTMPEVNGLGALCASKLHQDQMSKCEVFFAVV